MCVHTLLYIYVHVVSAQFSTAVGFITYGGGLSLSLMQAAIQPLEAGAFFSTELFFPNQKTAPDICLLCDGWRWVLLDVREQ